MTIKCISLNTFYGGIFFDEMVAFLIEQKPDIVFLQEVYNGFDESLEKNHRCFSLLPKLLQLEHAQFAPAFMHNTGEFKIEQGNAILSRFPLSNQEISFYDSPYNPDYEEKPPHFEFVARNLQIATATLPNSDKLTLANTQGIWGLDGGDSERRLAMSKTIVDRLTNKPNVILAGDFNLKPDTQTIRNIEKHYMNVFKDELVSTFNMKRKDNSGYATAVVDMAFVSPTLEIGEHNCPQVDISDHLPLVWEVEIQH